MGKTPITRILPPFRPFLLNIWGIMPPFFYLRDMIDYRSDTVTRPSKEMLERMHQAPVGDDVFMEDPSINTLEKFISEMFGMEAGLFCPSGTMTNQVAIKTHTQAGDEVICEELSHIYQYEGGGIAFNAGCSVKLLQGNRGRLTAAQVVASINPEDVHKPISRLISLENTTNRGGGACYDFNDFIQIKEVATKHNLQLHLDGARLFNAMVHKKEDPLNYGKVFDSISICLSKGLGAPVGSVLIGSAAFIKKARRWRKVLGGGMRQAGSLAAACMYALENNIERLTIDHANALLIRDALMQTSFVSSILEVETNIVIANIKGPNTAHQIAHQLKEKGVFVMAMSPTQIRFVTHLDITLDNIQDTIQIIKQL
jgi:threonine aldolase